MGKGRTDHVDSREAQREKGAPSTLTSPEAARGLCLGHDQNVEAGQIQSGAEEIGVGAQIPERFMK